ncbi:MAG: PEP-CTERM system histidine kinase PrsK [Gammaproteobacteria bacterium]|nr:PEP-CTERM system histidine kinase PrsK [Gammaproteobacteria bacterium]
MELLQDNLLIVVTVAYLVVAGALLWHWKGQLDRILLISAALVSAVWLYAMGSVPNAELTVTVRLAHLLQIFLWVSFLLKLLHAKHRSFNQRVLVIGVIFLAQCAALLLGAFSLLYETDAHQLPGNETIAYVFPVIILLMSLSGFYVVSRINERGRRERRANTRLLCLAVIFLLLYHVLFGLQHLTLGALLGIDWLLIVALYSVTAVLLLKSSLSRNARWMGEVYVSRDAVMYGAGAVLVALAIYCFMLFLQNSDIAGNSIGRMDYALAYLLLALVCSVVLIGFFSTRVRAHAHVFLSKHLFNYRYDYREEWLRLIHTLSKGGAGAHMLERVIQSVAQIVGSQGGVLWVNRHGEDYEPVARWGKIIEIENVEHAKDDLIYFLQERQWVIECSEYSREPELYGGLVLPSWLTETGELWLVVPLMQDIRLLGFVVLSASSIRKSINWEDRDLLKTAGRQAATHIAQLLATQALIEAQEFDTFNRLSAFVVHDLKNVVSQLSLITKNAERHRDNPEFIADTFATVASASRRGHRLLAQLRDRSPRAAVSTRVPLHALLSEVVTERSLAKPVPVLVGDASVFVMADYQKLKEVFSHLVENAQQATCSRGATNDKGRVEVSLLVDGQYVLVDVVDNGCGMDVHFIRERLFRAFDSTKGDEGMGIGVYQSREIVRALGGSIDVESIPGQGSKFSIKLPIIEK